MPEATAAALPPELPPAINQSEGFVVDLDGKLSSLLAVVGDFEGETK